MTRWDATQMGEAGLLPVVIKFKVQVNEVW
jgi:hypothetical protein